MNDNIPESKMRLYGFIGIKNNIFFDTEKEIMEYIKLNNLSISNTCIIDYLGLVAGCNDVIKVTYKDGNTNMYSPCDKDGYVVYNYDKSYYQGESVWEYNIGSIDDIINAFKDRNIIKENDKVLKKSKRKDNRLKKVISNIKSNVITPNDIWNDNSLL